MDKQYDWLLDEYDVLTWEPSTGHSNIRFVKVEVWHVD